MVLDVIGVIYMAIKESHLEKIRYMNSDLNDEKELVM